MRRYNNWDGYVTDADSPFQNPDFVANLFKEKRSMRANEIIAATFGWSVADINECRYQATRTSIPVYTSGEKYYCCPAVGQKCPKGFGTWMLYSDQFFAARENRQIYWASGGEES